MSDYLTMCEKKNDELKNAMEEIDRLQKENEKLKSIIRNLPKEKATDARINMVDLCRGGCATWQEMFRTTL
jgi:hypothetical protein